jgi:hypothetical protein
MDVNSSMCMPNRGNIRIDFYRVHNASDLSWISNLIFFRKKTKLEFLDQAPTGYNIIYLIKKKKKMKAYKANCQGKSAKRFLVALCNFEFSISNVPNETASLFSW